MAGLIDIQALESSIIWAEMLIERGKGVEVVLRSLIESEDDSLDRLALDRDLEICMRTLQDLGELHTKYIGMKKVLYN